MAKNPFGRRGPTMPPLDLQTPPPRTKGPRSFGKRAPVPLRMPPPRVRK